VIGVTYEGKKIVQRIVSGPTSYATGGFTVRFDEVNIIQVVQVSIRTNLKVDNLVQVVDYTYSGNTATIRVYRIDVTAAAPSAWSEVPAGTDISALSLEILVVGV